MKKLFLIFNVMLIFLITTIGRVKAYEEPIGYFFDKEYPITYINPDIMLMYDVNGYLVNSTIDGISFNQAFTVSSGNHEITLDILFPDTIDVNKSINIYVGGLLGGISSLNSSSNVVLVNPNGNYYSSLSASVNLLSSGGNAYGWQLECSTLLSEATSRIILSFNVSTLSSGSFYITSITVSEQSTDGLIASIATVLAELIPYIMNIDENIASILTWMSPILDAINSGSSSIVSAINSMSGSVVSAINSMSNAIQSDLNTINSSINSMNSNLGTKIDSMKTTLNNAIVTMMNTLNDSLNDLLGENNDTTNATNSNDSTTDNFDNVSGQYDDIEHSAVEDFENNLANVNTDTDLLNVADFKTSANFISTNLTNIFNSHDYIGNMIIFSLVIGFSLTLIGIKVRR